MKDVDGYTFGFTMEVPQVEVSSSIEDAKPGYTQTSISIQAAMTLTNTTPGRTAKLGKISLFPLWKSTSAACKLDDSEPVGDRYCTSWVARRTFVDSQGKFGQLVYVSKLDPGSELELNTKDRADPLTWTIRETQATGVEHGLEDVAGWAVAEARSLTTSVPAPAKKLAWMTQTMGDTHEIFWVSKGIKIR